MSFSGDNIGIDNDHNNYNRGFKKRNDSRTLVTVMYDGTCANPSYFSSFVHP